LHFAVGAATDETIGYVPPCPQVGEHRYFFHLYALSADLDLAPGSTKDELLTVMDDLVIEWATFIGRYVRK